MKQRLDDPIGAQCDVGPYAMDDSENPTPGDDGWWRMGLVWMCRGTRRSRMGIWYQRTDKRRFKLIEEEVERDSAPWAVWAPGAKARETDTPYPQRSTRRREQP